MVTTLLVSSPATFEEAAKNTMIRRWLVEKRWELKAPSLEWNYWHLELGNGSILPITLSLLIKMYLKDYPAGF